MSAVNKRVGCRNRKWSMDHLLPVAERQYPFKPASACDKSGGRCLDTQVGRRAFIYICAGAGLLSIGGVIGAAFVKSPEQLRAETAPPDRSLLTAPVEKRILASTVVTRGTVDAAARVDATPATVPGASTLVVTALTVSLGDSVRAGQVLLA